MTTTLRDAVLSAVVLLALASRALPSQAPSHAISRQWMRGTWNTVGNTDRSSVTFGDIQLLDADNDRLITYDYVDHKVKAVSLTGSLLWQVGEPGLQRGQFYNVTDLHHDDRGNIWIVDPVPQRITVLSPSGALIRTYEHVPTWLRVAPRSDGLVWALFPPDGSPGVYDTAGHLHVRPSLSTQLANLRIPANDLHLSPGSHDSVLIAYFWADRFVVLGADGKSPHEFVGIEARNFPVATRTPRVVAGQSITTVGVDSAARPAVLSATWSGAYIYVLPYSQRTAADTSSTIDVYRASSGAYVGSRALPARVIAFSINGDVIAGIIAGPHPTLRVWKWTADSRSAHH